MRATAKSKHQMLQEFTKLLYDHNPMKLPLSEMGEAGLDEYESEALSILSRFNESAINLCDDEVLQREISCGIVRQTFEFWFSDPNIHEPEKVAFALLDAFQASYPQPEQTPPSEVPSEA